MTDLPPFTDAELDQFEGWAKEDLRAGNLGQQAAARRTLRLVEAVRLLQLDATLPRPDVH